MPGSAQPPGGTEVVVPVGVTVVVAVPVLVVVPVVVGEGLGSPDPPGPEEEQATARGTPAETAARRRRRARSMVVRSSRGSKWHMAGRPASRVGKEGAYERDSSRNRSCRLECGGQVVRPTDGRSTMRMGNMKVVGAFGVLALGALALALAVVERNADAQLPRTVVVGPTQKALVVAGTDQTNQAIDTTAGAIQEVRVSAHAGGPYAVYIQAVAGHCQMSFATAGDAAQMAARVQDGKTTSVACRGPVATTPNNFIPLHSIDNATDITINGAP
jgi:hypothetical protein